MPKSGVSEKSHIELVRMSELLKILALKSRQSIYDRLRSDPSFPRPRQTSRFSIAWYRHEIDAYLVALSLKEFDGRDAVERRAAGG